MNAFTLTRRIAARPAIVFDALTTADGVASWWGPSEQPVTLAEMDARIGGAFRVRFKTDDGLEHEASGEFLEMDPPRRVVMSWRWTIEGEPDEAEKTSRIEIDLHGANAGATELTFKHEGLATLASVASHENGWTRAFDKLERRFEDADAEGTVDVAQR
jgi:uncharacterized protein YndB with AHSA1/START domain